MKTRLFFALTLSTVAVAPTIQAAPKAPAVNPTAFTLRAAKPPAALVKKLGGAKIWQSGLAPLGVKRETCWVFWLQPKPVKGKKNEAIFSVWKPTGKNRSIKTGEWKLGTNKDYSRANLAWLDYKNQIGWVMSNDVFQQGTRLIAFPQGIKTPQKGLVKDGPYNGDSTSMYATSYFFDSGFDKRGFYSINESSSEPGTDSEGNTTTISNTTVYLWNGKGWSSEK